ncbi:hypothetical protein ACCI51_08155 [Microbulbifer echini]|uniref:Uncharacterized protein n=1 Tax=Microbulbifer echini TaxID=1529067 RepID=A0ABV4NNA5_9GAMM
MKSLNKPLFFWLIFLSVSVSALEGPFVSDGAPKVRVSSSGGVTIYRMPSSANCYGDKINLESTESVDFRKMALSMVIAAQLSGKKINAWIDRYDSTTPQRCKLAFMEIEQ